LWIFTNGKWGIYKDVVKQADLENVWWPVKLVCFLLAYAPLPLFLFLMPFDNLLQALVFGASFGGAVYVVFNTTAYMLFPPWRQWKGIFPIAVWDTLWGVSLYMGVSVVSYLLAGV
jgi:hypothetical protein